MTANRVTSAPGRLVRCLFPLVSIASVAGITVWGLQKPPARTMALTFDDLPKSQGLEDMAGMRRTTESMVRVLRAHQAPAIAFVNEGKLYQGGRLVPGRVDLLKIWIDGGVPLGNHTYSHIDINRVTLEEYERDVLRGEATFARLMREAHRSERWFRHPFTHTGTTREMKAALDRFLTAHGYRIAPFTVEDSDWMFSAVYLGAERHGDRALADRIGAAYLTYVDTMVDWFESLARETFGRDIPQILLVHANELNTDYLDATLARLEARGYAFVPLAEVMRDPAYDTPDEFIGTYGPSWLHRWRVSKHLPPRMKDEPDPPSWIAK